MRTALFILIPALAAPLSAETQTLPVTADVGICAHPQEVSLNTGGKSRVRVKGNEHYYLFNFDVQAIRNWRVTQASLHVKLAGGHLRRVAFCTVPAEWVEGTAMGKAQAGSTCFTHVKYPSAAWGPHGLNMM
ncbi:MAG TPA: hypothetical protein VM098_03810, partial [Phycisphaerae bacterium]|nr:hypothetical protein [Phycisphaerae bacterium]